VGNGGGPQTGLLVRVCHTLELLPQGRRGRSDTPSPASAPRPAVPLWSGPSMTTDFRGGRFYDGALRTPLPCPLGLAYCVTVNVLPPIDVHTLLADLGRPATWAGVRAALGSTLRPGPARFLMDAVRQLLAARRAEPGRRHDVLAGAAAFLINQPRDGADIYPGGCARLRSRGEQARAGEGAQRLREGAQCEKSGGEDTARGRGGWARHGAPGPFSLVWASDLPHLTCTHLSTRWVHEQSTTLHAVLCPHRPPSGKYNASPYTLLEWIAMMLAPGTSADIDSMVAMGSRDATSWAEEHGLLPTGG
jgi:hypothetical protein